MPGRARIRWTVDVSNETDAAVRSHLAELGPGHADLSRFIEDAVRWRVFDQTIADARTGFSELSGDDIDALVDEAVAATRKEKPARRS